MPATLIYQHRIKKRQVECSIQKRIKEFEVRQEMRKQELECYKRILRPGIRLEKEKAILV